MGEVPDTREEAEVLCLELLFPSYKRGTKFWVQGKGNKIADRFH